MNTKSLNAVNRYRSIDGMRGIAALGVVVFHLSGNLKPELSVLLPEFINVIFSYGYLGVPVFFVISGFVISLSVKDSPITANYAGKFILRRSIRLDPTYWASIAVAILLLSLKNQVLGISEPTPAFSSVIAHMFYLQDLLSIEPVISVVYWTLCLEFQLYLFYLLTAWLSQKMAFVLNNQVYIAHLLLVILVGIYSVLVDYKLTTVSIPGLFISNWHYFLMGVLVSNALRKLPYSSFILMAWLVFEVAFQVGVSAKAYGIAGIISTVLIYCLWKHDLLDTVLTRGSFQYLGKLSYTLYLVHPDVGWKVISLGKLALHDYMSPLLAGFLFLAGIFSSIIFAHMLHVTFEKPSLWLCAKLKKSSLKEVVAELLAGRKPEIKDLP